MIPGFNHNITYKEQTFHVQTEDSGVNYPHILTHIYRHGDIIATRRSDYAHLLGDSHMEEQVLRLMQEQHKAMIRELIHGDYDSKIVLPETHHDPKSESMGEPQESVSAAGRALLGNTVGHSAAEPVIEKTQETEILPEPLRASFESVSADHNADPLNKPVLESEDKNQGPHEQEEMIPETTETPIYHVLGTDLDADHITIEQEFSDAPDFMGERDEKTTESIPPWPVDDDPPEVRQVAEGGVMAPPKGWFGNADTTDVIALRALESSEEGAPEESQQGTTQETLVFGDDLVSKKSLDEVILKYLKDEIESP